MALSWSGILSLTNGQTQISFVQSLVSGAALPTRGVFFIDTIGMREFYRNDSGVFLLTDTWNGSTDSYKATVLEADVQAVDILKKIESKKIEIQNTLDNQIGVYGRLLDGDMSDSVEVNFGGTIETFPNLAQLMSLIGSEDSQSSPTIDVEHYVKTLYDIEAEEQDRFNGLFWFDFCKRDSLEFENNYRMISEGSDTYWAWMTHSDYMTGRVKRNFMFDGRVATQAADTDANDLFMGVFRGLHLDGEGDVSNLYLFNSLRDANGSDVSNVSVQVQPSELFIDIDRGHNRSTSAEQLVVTESPTSSNSTHAISVSTVTPLTKGIARGVLVKDISARYVTVSPQRANDITLERTVVDLLTGQVIRRGTIDEASDTIVDLKVDLIYPGCCYIRWNCGLVDGGDNPRYMSVGFASPSGNALLYQSGDGGRQFIIQHIECRINKKHIDNFPLLSADSVESRVPEKLTFVYTRTNAPNNNIDWVLVNKDYPLTLIIEWEDVVVGYYDDMTLISFYNKDDITEAFTLGQKNINGDWRYYISAKKDDGSIEELPVGDVAVDGLHRAVLTYHNGVVYASIDGSPVSIIDEVIVNNFSRLGIANDGGNRRAEIYVKRLRAFQQRMSSGEMVVRSVPQLRL